MKHRLAELIKEHGLKHWSIKGQRDPVFLAWVNAETSDLPDATFMTRAYCATHEERPVCPRGNDRKLKGIEHGWGFCGKAAVCECCRDSVSASTKATKATETDEDRALTQAKREATSLAVHGHRNNGQTAAARAGHKAFYNEPDNVAQAMAKGRETMLEVHGVANGFQTEKANIARRLARPPESVARGAKKRIAHAQAGGLLTKSYPKLIERMHALGFKMLTPFEAYVGLGEHHYYEFQCHRCQENFKDYLFGIRNYPSCPRCDPPQRSWQNPSKEELTLHAFVKSLGFEPIFNSKRYISPLELDVLLLEQGIALEYCGEYWHHDEREGRGKRYHLDKLKRCQEKGIRLITIFSDEWFKRRIACETRLRHILGKSSMRVFARQTKVVELEMKEAATFLETYHTQGHLKNTTRCLGLRYGDELVSVMTFGMTRRENNADDIGLPGCWEMYRFASKGTVVGGASKLFKHFLRSENPQQVTSFCDRRWGEGEVYAQLGFVLSHASEPSEWWFKNGKRIHRWTLRKDKLVAQGHDPAKTAHEILTELKYRCVYDCGTHKFVWRTDK